MSFFKADSISAGYGKDDIIHDISFEVDESPLVGILGANGSGKTTILKAICGILTHEGKCTLDGTELETLSVREAAKLCSYIPQRSGISIDISALDVVLMGFNPQLKLLEHPTKLMKQRAMEALKQVGLGGMEQKNYLHMSEGQKQLCILARTLASDRQLLLLDEPESALDFRFRYQMLDIIRAWIKSTRRAALVSLHDPMLALNYCDELLLIDNGKLMGSIMPKKDSLNYMEQELNKIYGAVSLQLCKNRSGKDVIVMFKEEIL